MSSLDQRLRWWRAGEGHLTTTVARLSDDDLAAPSLLPGWDRRRLLAHLARNADALVNLLTWARTGVETPMYASAVQREADIADTTALPAVELRADLGAATGRLAEAVAALPPASWTVPVRTAQGRRVPAAQVPWMRSREVWVHAVDLRAGVDFAGVPVDISAALVDDVFARWSDRGVTPGLAVRAEGFAWGSGELLVAGPLPAVIAWLTGRSLGADLTASGPLPDLPDWL